MSFDDNYWSGVHQEMEVSIPFEQGDVFRHLAQSTISAVGTVSIPFEQGDVFRPFKQREIYISIWSQSLSSRAMSFDATGGMKQ